MVISIPNKPKGDILSSINIYPNNAVIGGLVASINMEILVPISI